MEHYMPRVEILPDTLIRFGEVFTIHAWLPTYEDKPDELRYAIDVFDMDGRQVDSTLWFARQDFVYEFDTTHPAYNITKAGTYLIKVERANGMERTGVIAATLSFKILKPDIIPAPLKQIKLGIKLGQIICNDDKTPVWNIHNKPACLTDQTYDKLLTRGWAKLRLLLPASGDPIKELEWTGQNELTMRFVGTYSISDEQPLSYDKKRQLAWEYVEQYYPNQKNILQYTTFGLQPFHKQCDVIDFDLIEWGNYKDCWDLGMKIRNSTGHVVYQEKINQVCLEPDLIPGTFTNYSSGIDFGGFRCHDPGLYLIEVENEKAHFPSTIIDTFVCTAEYGESKCPSGVISFDK
jgi:hypothetical protein